MSFAAHESLPDQRLIGMPASTHQTQVLAPTGGAKPPPRHRFWGSLRWRLSFWYVCMLTVILLLLGGFLLLKGSQILYQGTYETFRQDSREAANVGLANIYKAMLTRDAVTKQCPTPSMFAATFQAKVSDPLIQEPSDWQSITLLDPKTGAVIAPSNAIGSIPPQLDMQQLTQLRTQISGHPDSLRNWSVQGISKGSAVYYTTNHGTNGVYLVAYGDYAVAVCPVFNPVTGKLITAGKLTMTPAVLMMTRAFTGMQATVRSFATLLIAAVAIFFVLGLGIGVPVTSASLKLLSRVTVAAQKLAQGDLHQRVMVTNPKDEIGDLAQSFNYMAEQVENAFRTQQQSEQRMRMFVADASHELRTPITAIRGYLDVLARSRSSPAETAHILQSARREAERMTRLVNDLLTLARFDNAQQLTLAGTDIWNLAGEAVDQARLLAGLRDVTLQGDGAGRLLAMIDADRVKQVLLVLLDNALKYGRQDPGGWVHVVLRRTPTLLIIQISDNGPGIPTDEVAYIFERFYRARHYTEVQGQPLLANGEQELGTTVALAPPAGSGLGLAIARTIVQAHAGTITVTSVVGHGTTFTIQLPLMGPNTPGHEPTGGEAGD